MKKRANGVSVDGGMKEGKMEDNQQTTTILYDTWDLRMGWTEEELVRSFFFFYSIN